MKSSAIIIGVEPMFSCNNESVKSSASVWCFDAQESQEKGAAVGFLSLSCSALFLLSTQKHILVFSEP